MDSKDKDIQPDKEMLRLRHKLVYDIEQRFNQFSLNTVVSGFMEYNNKLIDLAKTTAASDKETLKTFVVLLAPFAPSHRRGTVAAAGRYRAAFSTPDGRSLMKRL